MYVSFNLICWWMVKLATASISPTILMLVTWSVVSPLTATLSMTIWKLKHDTRTYSWPAYACGLASVIVAAILNYEFAIKIIAAV